MNLKKFGLGLVSAAILAGCSAGGASNGNTVKLGGNFELTGNVAAYGSAMDNAVKLAVEQKGKLLDKELKYVSYDNKSEKTEVASVAKKLVSEKVVGVVGPATTGDAQVSIPIMEQAKIPAVFPATTGDGITLKDAKNPESVYDYIFRVCFSDPAQGAKSAQYIGSHKLGTKIGIIYDSSDVYSTGVHDSFKEEAPKQGLEIVADEQFTADSNKDFSTQLQKMKDSGADLVFLPFYYTEAALVLTQANTMGYKPTFFGCDGMDGILNVENFDTKLADGLMLLTPFAADAKDELTVNFVKNYKEKYKDTPIQFAADAYDAVYIVKAAIEKANLTPDMGVSDLGDALEKTMTELTLDGLTGSGMKWDASGDVDKEPKAVIIKDGVYISAE